MRHPGLQVVAPEIRIANGGDGAAVAAVYRPYVEDSAISFEVDPPDEWRWRERIEHDPRNGTPGSSAWTVADVVGYAYASEHKTRAAYRWAAECVCLPRGRMCTGGGLVADSTSPSSICCVAQNVVNAYAGHHAPESQERRASRSTRLPARSACTSVSASSSAPGATSAGGSWRCSRSHSTPAEPRRWPDVPERRPSAALAAGVAAIARAAAERPHGAGPDRDRRKPRHRRGDRPPGGAARLLPCASTT